MHLAPLRTYEYTLTRADALAYARLPRPFRGWRFYVLALWLASSGLLLALLPESWVGPEGGWRFWLIGVGLLGLAGAIAAGVLTLATRFRAYRRVPAPIAMRVEQWRDRFSIEAGGRTRALPFDAIGGTATTGTHLFVIARRDVLILPARLFSGPSEMRLLARRLNAHGVDADDADG